MCILDQLLCGNLGEKFDLNFYLLLLFSSRKEQQLVPSPPLLLIALTILPWSCSPQTPSQIQLTWEPLGWFGSLGKLLLGSCTFPAGGRVERQARGTQGSSPLSLACVTGNVP